MVTEPRHAFRGVDEVLGVYQVGPCVVPFINHAGWMGAYLSATFETMSVVRILGETIHLRSNLCCPNMGTLLCAGEDCSRAFV